MERIPSRNEFDVPHQVYEWFRELSDTVQKIENEDQDEGINILLGFFKGISEEIDLLRDEVDSKELENAQLKGLMSEIESLNQQLDTSDLLNAKIKELEETISLLPEESELSLFKAFKGLEVKTYEYKGTVLAGVVFLDVNITEILGQGESIVEATSTTIESANLTSEIISSTTVRLSRIDTVNDSDYVIKIKDYRNN